VEGSRRSVARRPTRPPKAVARHKPVPRAAQAVVVYVQDAVDFVDGDVVLPLPADGFARRIEEMTAGV
jgi:hypothetical protein